MRKAEPGGPANRRKKALRLWLTFSFATGWKMIPDLKWLVGSSLTNIEKIDYTWAFRFGDGTVITTDGSPWRLVTETGVAVTSEDHGQQFGLPSSVDAAERLKTKAVGKTIDRAFVDSRTGDLTVAMGTSFLTFLCLSMGYESWHLTSGDLEFVCMGGGRVEQIQEDGKG
jgi:hypothetical protein